MGSKADAEAFKTADDRLQSMPMVVKPATETPMCVKKGCGQGADTSGKGGGSTKKIRIEL